MAKIELLVDDMDGTPEHSRPIKTHTFEIDGEAFEIDLHDDNAAGLKSHFAHYIERARPVRKTISANHPAGKKIAVTPGRRVRAQVDKAQLDAERAWLRAQGHTVSNYGKISAELHGLYVAAHPPTKPSRPPMFSAMEGLNGMVRAG